MYAYVLILLNDESRMLVVVVILQLNKVVHSLRTIPYLGVTIENISKQYFPVSEIEIGSLSSVIFEIDFFSNFDKEQFVEISMKNHTSNHFISFYWLIFTKMTYNMVDSLMF